MTCYTLDTSVVLRLLVGTPADQAPKALDFLEDCYSKGVVVLVSDLVILETWHALRHHYQVPVAEAAESILEFLSSEMITPTGHALSVLQEYPGSGPGLPDRLLRNDYLDHASTILTFDKKFARLPDMKNL
jgi:predicted nucleic acid-binding protein